MLNAEYNEGIALSKVANIPDWSGIDADKVLNVTLLKDNVTPTNETIVSIDDLLSRDQSTLSTLKACLSTWMV